MKIALAPALAAALLGLSACHPHAVREAVTEEQIIRWSHEGFSADEIIDRIRASRTVYLMEPRDVIALHEQGVDQRVIDYMWQTERWAAERHAHHHYHDPYWHGYVPFHFGFGWSF